VPRQSLLFKFFYRLKIADLKIAELMQGTTVVRMQTNALVLDIKLYHAIGLAAEMSAFPGTDRRKSYGLE